MNAFPIYWWILVFCEESTICCLKHWRQYSHQELPDCSLHTPIFYCRRPSCDEKPFRLEQPPTAPTYQKLSWFWSKCWYTRFLTYLNRIRNTSKNINVLANTADSVSFNPFIRQIDLFVNFLPAKYVALYILTGLLHCNAWTAITSNGSICRYGIVIDNSKIIQSSKGVCNCWIFLVYQILFTIFEYKFECVRCLQIQLYFTKSQLKYFSSLFFRGL